MGVVLQKAVLFKGTIRENLLWGKEDATDEEIYRALDISQAREFIDTREGGWMRRLPRAEKIFPGGRSSVLLSPGLW